MRTLAALTLAAVLAVPAFAQAAARDSDRALAAPLDPNAVIYNGNLIGRDPDPFIRHELLRHAESGWPD